MEPVTVPAAPANVIFIPRQHIALESAGLGFYARQLRAGSRRTWCTHAPDPDRKPHACSNFGNAVRSTGFGECTAFSLRQCAQLIYVLPMEAVLELCSV